MTELSTPVIATVNGKALSVDMYEFLLGSRQRDSLENTEFAISPEEQSEHASQTAHDLVMTEVLAQEAQRQNVHLIPANKIELELAHKTLLAQLLVRQIMADIKVDDNSIQAAYDAQIETTLYRFNLWFAPDRDQADQLLQSLLSQNEQAIRENPIERIETPWLEADEIDPQVLPKLESLKENEFLVEPVPQDGFWKVVQVIDKNVIRKPPFEEAKDMIKAELIQAQVNAAIDNLAMNSDINLNAEHYP